MYDVVIVGAGPAGLSAALILGRSRRHVLVCDTGKPRNAASHAMHGFLSRDGMPPAEFLRIAREQLRQYDSVDMRDIEVIAAECIDSRFHVTLQGGGRVTARKLLIATGVVDNVPDIPGFGDLYGTSVFHCPYCDGWEVRDRRLAAFGQGRHVAGLALGLKTWSGDVVACTNGTRLEPRLRERLAMNGVQVRTDRITHLEHQDGVLAGVSFASGDPLPRDAMFFSTGQHPQCDLAIKLGCTLTSKGAVKTGTQCDTNVPRLFVVGDASRDAQFVVVAAAEGVKAAVAINKALQSEELAS